MMKSVDKWVEKSDGALVDLWVGVLAAPWAASLAVSSVASKVA